ncbi:two-component system response regulator protein [Indibacter alkaliphilus LW1]|jgi:DNA-binding LytR/AlgR family response regulator|uniref:Two-component system response regulator protein n=1 Tax=Indibacter alkaliphilus (strain CCUG 57479 / KCTC 22604 / LW1) TaxID=1189612 RepID=S2E845_INDAL|nr:LytTR family DNA-binding domain-containing protein [Indibacter alkaliphilus]EOZ98458.1 two-component system response regulator protein [Indibacter alkaliphilus LW1]
MKEVLKDYSTKSNGNNNGKRTLQKENKLLVKDALFVRNKGNLVKVKFKDIMWMKGDGNYTTLVTRDSVYSLRNILKEFESVLPEEEFIRIHKSYIVRIEEILTINPKELTVGKDSVPVGRTYYQNLINGINKLGSGGGE